MNIEGLNNILSVDTQNFTRRCLELFRFQYETNIVYKQWCDHLNVDVGRIEVPEHIPFLPISFFKTARIVCGAFNPEVVFESSGTTQTTNSRHFIKSVGLYRLSFLEAFRKFYGDPAHYCILALLPSYLERGNSSLVFMVDELMRASNDPNSGFYLHDHQKLAGTLKELEAQGRPTILFGVTYALLDFADAFPMQLRNTIIIETGGMKGRKREMTRQEVHTCLQQNWQIEQVHSEYSMTELLSQAYSTSAGRFECPPWMRVLVRSEDDPLEVRRKGRGVINIIDLANVYSCGFIATDDAAVVYDDGRFEVLGRIDNSDIRGCSLLAL